MVPPLYQLRLLAPPVRLLLGAMWRIAHQQAHEHYGMLEEFVVAATEAVPELLSAKERTVLLLALRTKMFLADPDPCHLDQSKASPVTDGEWEWSMSCLKDAVSKGLDPQTLSEVFGHEFDVALESLLSHFLSRLQQRLPVPDFTKVSTLLQDDWLKDCLQEVKSQELKELLTNHSVAQKPTCPDGELKSEVVLKSAWQQLLHLQKIDESKQTYQKQDQLETANGTQELPRATTQKLAVPKPLPATANQAPVFTLLNLLPNHTTLFLIPTNQSAAAVLPTNQSTAAALPTNQSTTAIISTNQQPTRAKSTNQKQTASKRRYSKVASVTKPTNQEPPLHQAEGSDQSEPSSSALIDQSEAVSTEAPSPDSVSQKPRRLAQKCPQCNKCFIYRNQVLKHLESSRTCSSAPRPVKLLSCFQCHTTFQTKTELRTHLRTHRTKHPILGKAKPNIQTQPDPDSKPKTRTRVRPQKETVESASKKPEEKPLSFCCSLCEQRFKTQALLLTHLDSHLVQGDTPRFECLYCDQTFTGSTLLRIHQRTHVPRPFTCDVCGKGFGSAYLLTGHKKTHGEKRFLCHTCGRGFISRQSLQTHARTHSDQTPYTCTLCGRGFKFSAGLRVHLRRHLGDKPYTCTVCGKSFHSSGDLQPHMRIHTGEKPYSCRDCGKKFVVSSHLRVHLRMHSGEKPHSCPECGKQFVRKGDMDGHIRSAHFNEKPFTCPRCPKTYTCKNHLRRHQRTHQDTE